MCVCQCVSTSHTLTEISESLISFSFPGIFSQSWSPDVTQMNVNEKWVSLDEKLKPGYVGYVGVRQTFILKINKRKLRIYEKRL